MPRPRNYSRESIAREIAIILSHSDISERTKLHFARGAQWGWTEFDGKIEGCRWWSQAAIDARARDPKAKLIHEHVVPRKVLAQRLVRLNPITPDAVFDLLTRFAIACIVTPEEDARLSKGTRTRMPEPFDDPAHPDYDNPWLRYRLAGITVVDRANF